MPVEATPLFRRDVVRDALRDFELPAHAQAARERLAAWAELLSTARGLEYKESELLPDFLTDVFQELLGYTGPSAASSAGRHTLSRERLVEVGGKFADAVLGDFREGRASFVAAIEGKGPKDPLERPFAGRAMSAVDQAYRYAINLPCDWIVVTNLREVRLYSKNTDQRTYERWETAALATDARELRRFVFVLGAERVVPLEGRSHLYALREASDRAGESVTQAYYREYARIRRETLAALLEANPALPPEQVLGATQTLLDRVLFIAFAEDRGLLPPGTLERAYRHRDPYNPRPVWANFQGLFRAVDAGSEALGVPAYNGGLFRSDALLDQALSVPDVVCRDLERLGAYSYRAEPEDDDAPEATAPVVDVEILGHIFEQSIEDLEALRAELGEGPAAAPAARADLSRRRREGAFYTPAFITRYIVSQALEPTLAERFERLRRLHQERASGTQPKALEEPGVYDLARLNEPQRAALAAFWEAWLDELATVRVLDPACGSGAFLLEAFDQLHVHYQQAVDRLAELRGQPGLFDPDRAILRSNLFGVDLNGEAVDIARLSIWIKTAQRGKALSALDHNIRVGNSVVADSGLDPRAFDWRAAFPEVFDAGGFDVVVGNPPYVRGELLGPLKEHFQRRFRAYHGSADLYVYFYELGLQLLRPGGRLSYVVTNKWLRAGYGEPLRRLFGDEAWVEAVVDFGHARRIFPDADVFPSILLARKPTGGAPPEDARVCVIPRDQLRIDDLAAQIGASGFPLPRSRLGAGPWSLEPPGVQALMEKIRAAGPSLKEYAGTSPAYGIKTGLNEAFLVDSATRERLVREDPASAGIIRPYLRGQDVKRWVPDWAGIWMIVLKSSGDHAWPWSDAGEEAEGCFARTYPSIHAHMKPLEARLRARTDQGAFWWELRSCAYYEMFEKPKIVWKDLAFHSEFALDETRFLTNNLCYLLPTSDRWLLAVLNSPLSWWVLWRTAQHGKDEVLRLANIYTEALPIATGAPKQREQAEALVERLRAGSRARTDAVLTVLDWLRMSFGIEDPGTRLRAPHLLEPDDFVAEVRKRRPGRSAVSASELALLRREYGESIAPLRAGVRTAALLERELAALVNAAFGLTPEDVALLYATAPPRMPLAEMPPAESEP